MSQDVNAEMVREMLERLGENPELRLMNGDLWLMYGEPTPEDIQRGEQDPVSYGWLPSDVYLTGPARDAERVDSEELLDLVLRSPDLARAYLALHARAEALERAAVTLHGYSRRYCDGRSTYAPSEHNEVTHTLLALGVELPVDPVSKTGPFASDGMYGLTDRDRAALAALPAPAPQQEVEEDWRNLPSITLEEYVRREGPNWAGVTDSVAYVRSLRGDAPAPQPDVREEVRKLRDEMVTQIAWLEGQDAQAANEQNWDTAARYHARHNVLRPWSDRLTAILAQQPTTPPAGALSDADVRMDVITGATWAQDRRVARATYLPTGWSVEVHRGQGDMRNGEWARRFLTLLVADAQAPASVEAREAADEREVYWKAGFLRGAKYWDFCTNGGASMWQADQQDCWREAHRLWPHIPLQRIDEARQIVKALALAPQAEEV